jgi:nicotinate-nucleotide adenylyltransferase
MTAMAFKKEHRVDVDDREIKRKGLTYSIDTLRELKQDLGNQISLVWIMGQDVFSTLHEWHKWQEFINEVHLLVMTRPNSFFDNKKISKYLLNSKKTHNFEDLLSVEYTKIFPYSVTPVDISSSQIRENIKLGLDVSSMVFKEVFDHINTEGLYLE